MTKKDSAKYIQAFQDNDRLGALLGVRLTSISIQECWAEYTVSQDHFNPGNILHGGALFSAMDSCQGAYLHFILDDHFQGAVTGTATVKYLAPVTHGKIKIKSWMKEIQNRKYFVLSSAVDESGKEVATLEEIWIALKK